MTDLVVGLVAYLRQNAEVSTLTQVIYDEELDLTQDNSMPAKVVVLKSAGGPAGPRQLRINDNRITVVCYGETPHLARVLYVTTYDALKALTPSVWANTYIHWCNESSGGMSTRDPITQWPYVAASWLVRASDVTITT